MEAVGGIEVGAIAEQKEVGYIVDVIGVTCELEPIVKSG